MRADMPDSSYGVLSGNPVIGDAGVVRAMASFVNDISLDAHFYKLGVERSSQTLSRVNVSGIDRLRQKIDGRLSPGAQSLLDSANTSKSAFDSYASELDRIRQSAGNVRSNVNTALETIRTQRAIHIRIAAQIRYWGNIGAWNVGPERHGMPEPRLGPNFDDSTQSERDAELQYLRAMYELDWSNASINWNWAVEDITKAKNDWATLIEDQQRAERTLKTSLAETTIGQLISLAEGTGDTRKHMISVAISGELWGTTEAPPTNNTSHPLLESLIGTEDGSGIWDNPPDPMTVAQNWEKLTDWQRQRLIEQVPWVIGNLPGLPFNVRDEANRITLRYYAWNPSLLSMDSRTACGQLVTMLAEGKDKVPPTVLVALNLDGSVPMVAVGYGNLDTADNLTWQVPGMESDAQNSLAGWDSGLGWDAASRNLYDEQLLLSGGSSVGVIAFLSYDTPNLLDSWNPSGVLGEGKARDGAPRFAAELDGTYATRNTEQTVNGVTVAVDPPRIAVAAHSYGTTTAANALTLVKYAVDSFSMAGSAGLDENQGWVESFDSMNVKDFEPGKPAIFASHAEGDTLAPIGLTFSGRGNPSLNKQYWFDTNPNYYDGYYYSSDGTEVDGQVFTATDGHSILGMEAEGIGGWIKDFLGFEAPEGQGYWDSGTQSLRNIAVSTLGLDRDEFVGGLYEFEDMEYPLPTDVQVSPFGGPTPYGPYIF